MNSIFRNIHLFALIGLSLSLPFSLEHIKITSFFIILVSANAIPYYFTSSHKVEKSQTIYLLLFVSTFLMYLWSLLTTSNMAETLFVLEKKLAILLFPLALYFTPPLSQKQLRLVLFSFVLACMNTAIFSLSVATVHFVCWNDAAYFSYRILSSTVGMHAIYLSIYYCFAVAILLFLFFDKQSSFSLRDKFLYYLCLSILCITTILLAGRVAIVILILEMMIYITLLFKRKNTMFVSLVKGSIIGLILLSAALIPEKNRIRLKEAINYKGEYSVDKKETSGAVVRPYIWSCAFSTIENKLIFGSGAGDTQGLLTNCYKDRSYTFLTEAENMTFNAHNQYLEIAIGTGIIGLLIFVYSMYRSIKESLRTKNFVFLTFLFIFLSSCFTESMLERQSGIVFFGFFNALLFFNILKNEKDII